MARLMKYIKCSFHVFNIIFLSYFFSRNETILNRQTIIRYHADIKHLLIWSSLPGVTELGQKHFIEKKCYYLNCYFTTNRSLFSDLRYFDGIVFNLQEVSAGIQDLPRVRGEYQKYIFAANDSADNFPVCNPVYDNFFNWTWTYKKNSTIPYRFITIYNSDNEDLGTHFRWQPMDPVKADILNGLNSKSIAAAAFIDKCKTRSNREGFIKNLLVHLQKYNMTIDVYGKCGTMECRKKTLKPCFWRLKKYYYFYLAFEDSMGDDFVTKSVLYAYDNSAVPIVYGKADYDKYLPPDSYLNGYALGEEKLALKMYQIAFDSYRYVQFFKWRSYYSVKESKVLSACTLCAALNNPNWLVFHITYSDFRAWWNKDYKKRCEESSETSYTGF